MATRSKISYTSSSSHHVVKMVESNNNKCNCVSCRGRPTGNNSSSITTNLKGHPYNNNRSCDSIPSGVPTPPWLMEMLKDAIPVITNPTSSSTSAAAAGGGDGGCWPKDATSRDASATTNGDASSTASKFDEILQVLDEVDAILSIDLNDTLLVPMPASTTTTDSYQI